MGFGTLVIEWLVFQPYTTQRSVISYTGITLVTLFFLLKLYFLQVLVYYHDSLFSCRDQSCSCMSGFSVNSTDSQNVKQKIILL